MEIIAHKRHIYLFFSSLKKPLKFEKGHAAFDFRWDCSAHFCWTITQRVLLRSSSFLLLLCVLAVIMFCLVWQPVILTWMLIQDAEKPHKPVNKSVGKSAKRFSEIIKHQKHGPDIQLRPKDHCFIEMVNLWKPSGKHEPTCGIWSDSYQSKNKG